MPLSERLTISADGVSERTVWPVIFGYAETSRLLVAWCELRQAFRHFRSERIVTAILSDEPIGLRSGELRRRWQQWREQQISSPKRSPCSERQL